MKSAISGMYPIELRTPRSKPCHKTAKHVAMVI